MPNPADAATTGAGDSVAPARGRSRAERFAQRERLRRQQRAASRRRRWLPWAVIGGLVVLAVAAVIVYVNVSPSAQPISGVERFSDIPRDHVTGPQTYAQFPPVGGLHNPVWQNCGVYDQPVPSEFAVHSMEHGAVWITYRPELTDDQVQALRAVARGKDYVLLSPWSADPPLPSPIVASAWGLQLELDSAADPRLAEFARRYANGPQTPERMAACTGGVGTPLQTP
jgi:hypothetical protein